MPDGYCMVECTVNADCGMGYHCIQRHYFSICMAVCERNMECRTGYSCRQEPDGTGSCWRACQSSDDCNGQQCNGWGLCGNDTPPRTDMPPAPDPCACDETYGCDDNCACDPDCGKDSCAAVEPASPSVWYGLMPLLWRWRRRRSGGR